MNLHTHTNYCDGLCDPVEYFEKAIELNWKFIGFSAHAPIPFQCEWCINESDITNYIHEIQSLGKHYQKAINTYIGWEIDYLHGKDFPALQDIQILEADYHICSIHYLPILKSNNNVIEYIEIDGSFSDFSRIVNYYNDSLGEVLNLYLNNLKTMLSLPIPEVKIIGHIDKICINAEQFPIFKKYAEDFYNQLYEILRDQPKNTVILEINTRSIYNKNRSNPYPNYQFLNKISDLNIPTILSSDAHHACELKQGFSTLNEQIEKQNISINWLNVEDFISHHIL
jgi:histidinol-phosphatase (PHP family)